MSPLGEVDSQLHDPGVEVRVLSCLLKSQEAWLAEGERISADDFITPLNRNLYLVIDSVYSQGALLIP